MGTQEFIVLYTHQKLKKAKVWQDGILKISHLGNKAILYDDKGQCLESIFLKCLEVKPGDDLEGDRYLVTIEEVKTAGPTTLGQTVAKAAPGLGKCVPSGRAQGCQPAGLKRKFTGFQGPRQVPPKVVVTENSELAPTLEAKKAGPLFLSSLYDTSPLFSVAGQKDINSRPAVAENSVAYENRERNSMLPFSSSAFKIHPEMRGDEHDFCSPVSPENKCSRSFPTDEPMKRDGLSLHHSGVSHSIRSKARILALLKSKPTGVCTELDSELREHRPQVQPHGCGTIPPQPGCSAEQEECAERKRPEELQYPQLSGNTAGKTSRWAIYLPSQRSPEHSSVEEENDPAGKPKAQEGSLDSRRDILAQKRKHFETCAERGREGNEDNPVDNHDPPWAQEGELESPSSRESSAARVTFGPVENGDFLSESRIQENRKIRVHQSNPMRLEESLLIRENAEERSRHVEPKEESGQGLEPEHLQMEPSLRTNARLSDDITHVSSESNSDNENLNQISKFRDNAEQPLVEVTFNLNSFEASDTEEEAQGSHKMSQDSEDWREETSGTDEHSGHQRQHDEDESCKDAGGAHLHLLTSSRGEPTEPLSQFCDKTRVGFYPGLWKAGNTGKEIEQECNDTLSNFDSSLEWPDDENVDNKEANQSKSSIHNVFIALPNTSKKTETSSLMPHFSNIATNQPSKNNLFSEQAQPFVWGNDSDVNDEQVLFPSTSSYNERVQPLDAKQNHFEERVALGESHTQVSNAFFHPLGTRNPISKDTEVHIPVSKDLEVETAGGKEYSNSPKTPLEPSGFINDISLLKSLSEHSTALEGLEIMRRRNNTLKQQQSLRTAKPQSCPEAGGPLTTLASQAVPKPPHLDQESPQMLKENEVEPAEPLQSLEFFSLNTEEEPPFVAFTPKQIEIAACDPQPVEFQGHQVRGSAAGAMMLRRPSTPQGHSLFPGSVRSEKSIAGAWLLAPQAPGTGVQADFLQFPNEDYFPKGSTSFNIEDGYQAIIESEKDSCENDLMERSSFLENENLAELPLVSGTRAPLTALPSAADPPGFALQPNSMHWDSREAPRFPLLTLQEDSVLPASGFGRQETGFPRASRASSPEAASRRHHKEAAASKWLKYQNLTQRATERDAAGSAHTVLVGGPGPRQQDALHASPVDSEHLQRIKDMLGPQQQAYRSQDPGSGGKAFPEVNCSELCFPSGQKTKSAYLPQRHVHIPAVFQSPAQYKQIFTSCLIEHLNIMLFGLAQRLHRALAKVDISFYTSPKGEEPKSMGKNVPSCYHQQPAKLVMVKKDGPNKGRLFYACDGPKADQCKFFKWFEAVTPGNLVPGESPPVKVLSDIKSIGLYLRSQKIPVYEECQLLVRKGFDFQRKQYGKLKKFAPVNSEFCNNEPKSKLYLKLSRKESSSTYSKDDLWVVSKTLDFELDTFIACSAFFGPSSVSEVELLPLKGYFPSNWPSNTVVHALLVCNASTELTTLKNIQDHFNPATLPLTQGLLTMSPSTPATNKPVSRRKFTPPAFSSVRPPPELPSLEAALRLASELAQAHRLNQDQAAALNQIARMMAPQPVLDNTAPDHPACPITIIHGVFGAGKSYLLALVVLFFVQLFEQSEAAPLGNARPWKVLISSSTNVAVDRVLLGLLSLGFEKFVRVGSIRKIAKPILPYSLHAGSENESEQLKELQALLREDLSPVEKAYVRKSIEQHKLGTNRTLLRQVRVVGVTCAACPFPCLNDLKFPVVVLDECSQITEPASLLPIARFECEKLILVGDPKQLPPTIQGSDAAHENGLEQTLFDRLCLMGHEPVLLRTQYRCHPAISAIVNDLFYEGRLLDGVSNAERGPLQDWLPTLCFYNVRGLEQMERDNSFHNVAEAAFTLKLIQSLLASGVAGSVIGVITLYKSQMYKLCQALSASNLDHPDLRAVQVSTVDAFQGAEKEVIILSCVRTLSVGFIDSGRRMNVALTRGRRHLLIVGNLACLRENRLWGRVIQHCQGRDGGLQHASQFEPQLDRLLQEYSEEQAAAKQKKKGKTET